MQFKIVGGTPMSGPALCRTCKYGKYVRGQNGEERLICGGEMFGGSKAVTFKVSECSKFHPLNVPWMYEMEDMAWIIEARKRGPKGFLPDGSKEEGSMEVIVRRPGEREPGKSDD